MLKNTFVACMTLMLIEASQATHIRDAISRAVDQDQPQLTQRNSQLGASYNGRVQNLSNSSTRDADNDDVESLECKRKAKRDRYRGSVCPEYRDWDYHSHDPTYQHGGCGYQEPGICGGYNPRNYYFGDVDQFYDFNTDCNSGCHSDCHYDKRRSCRRPRSRDCDYDLYNSLGSGYDEDTVLRSKADDGDDEQSDQ